MSTGISAENRARLEAAGLTESEIQDWASQEQATGKHRGPEVVERIKQLYEQGMSQRSIAFITRVSTTTVSYHVDDERRERMLESAKRIKARKASPSRETARLDLAALYSQWVEHEDDEPWIEPRPWSLEEASRALGFSMPAPAPEPRPPYQAEGRFTAWYKPRPIDATDRHFRGDSSALSDYLASIGRDAIRVPHQEAYAVLCDMNTG